MKKQLLALGLSVAASFAVARAASAAEMINEQFDYPTGTLVGDVNANGATWRLATSQTSTTAINVVSNGLNGMGNGLAITGSGNSSGAANRLGFAAHTSPVTQVTSGTVYYSFDFEVTATTGSNATNGGFFIALNNTDDAATTTNPSTTPGKVQLRQTPGHTATNFDIEIVGNHNATGADGNWTTLSVGTTYSLVGAYNIDTNTASLWINPDAGTFGATSAPAASQTDTAGTAVTSLASVIVRQSPAPYVLMDNLRVGTSWADVTSVAAVPEPASVALVGIGGLGLLMRRRRTA